ncbi:hypothetical protein ACNPNM_04130 [Klebsiella variicola]|uniref:hypothetical protein n=1 Tax=Klebsiella pneumoniae complex TaxID=3390273 RepID=UPI000E2CC3A7|nr:MULTISPECIES: hypothetical protein [Klebsiella]HBS3519831.1 hypothetical protein [Klebsiella variicola subsp. variicola]HCA9960777.1 hypothetical protein [Klebsiella quasipneumoniae subsp. quasipneumoniae]MCD6611850.1 hypothetical protein [Klebsiella quasipneumoniae subsp. similipneumoniae]MCP6656227.1 hypothetical protein [Klebsiella pneumoniae]VVJ59050.1 Uncharacterised protein [Klebsiella pneumoniae]
MSYYIRSVKSDFWEGELPEDGYLSMSVDGITNCCQTSSNTLSIWETDSLDIYDDNNKRLLTAIALIYDKPRPLTFIFLTDEELSSIGVTLQETPGATPVEDCKEKHRDICKLTLDSIGKLAWIIHKKVNSDDFYNLVSEDEVSGFTKEMFPEFDSLPEKNKTQKKWRGLY